MKQDVVLSIRGKQTDADTDPEVIELVTEGTMEYRSGGWDISYQESALTGLEGVTTTFHVEPDRIILRRTGKLQSEMIFQEGVSHDSLYQMAFGAMMMRVTATFVYFDIVEDGGTIDVSYNIDIENTAAGVIDYHLDIRAK